MKNDDRIIELLAEYLRKTDIAIESIQKHEEYFKAQIQVLLEHSKQIEFLRQESLKHNIQQDEILKEIFSISKRVKDLEEK